MKGRVAILFHRNQTPADARLYLIHYIADAWRADGLEVTYLFGPERHIPADLVLIHVDLSVVPEEYLELAQRYPVALNTRVADVRKSKFSGLRVGRDSGYRGRVIVKSDLNYGGTPERVLARERGRRQRARDRWPGVADQLRRFRRFRAAPAYNVYDGLDEVPERYLDDDEYIVERFVPEMEDGRFHTRYFDFLGEQFTCVRVSSRGEIPRGNAQNRQSEEVDPDPELFRVRSRLGIDFGRFDYLYHEGTFHLLDINKTPGIGGVRAASDHARKRQRHWAAGIYPFLR